MKYAMVKMIITDLDGTLLRNDKSLSEYTVNVWEECKRRGIITGIATARLEASVTPVQSKLHADLLICSNGSKIIFRERLLSEDVLGAETVRRLTKRLVQLSSSSEILVEAKTEIFANTHRFTPSHPLGAAVYSDFADGLDAEANQVYVSIEKEDEAEKICREFPECRCIHYRDSTRYAFIGGKVSKENALVRAAEMLGIPLSATAAFGDDDGDKEMLSLCGLGVAVGNALPGVKGMADIVTGTNEEDGVAEFIEQKILREAALLP